MSVTLELNFAAAKSLAAVIGPTPVIARNSIGTHLDAAGILQEAAIDAARFDHDTISLASLGLLSEEERLNYTVRTNGDYKDWGSYVNLLAYGSGSVADAITAPDGTDTADLIVPTTLSTNQHYFRQLYSYDPGAGTTFTTSIFAKAEGYDSISMRNIGTDAPIVTYDLTAISHNSSADHAEIIEYPNGWRRCLLSGNRTGTQYNYVYPNKQSTFAGDGVSGVYFWGGQGEVGTIADVLNRTSFIPQPLATPRITREADVITSSDVTWLGTGTTKYTKFNSGIIAAAKTIWSIHNGTADERVSLEIDTSGNLHFIVVDGGTTLVDISTAIAAHTDYEVAVAWAANDAEMCVDGVQIGTDAGLTLPTMTTYNIGSDHADAEHLNSTVARIVGYNERLDATTLLALSNGEGLPAIASGGSGRSGPGLSFGGIGKLGA